ncbi:MAG: respiratory nitrate reductase subunit gamma [Planctomycetes bacterium]|nr:respiratory nitrate reductase subunit gamma [Planctomycetota bacterium]MCW8135557.1 respiratory nitrate reductase subunit gamma [Planctomycetota bacterium]
MEDPSGGFLRWWPQQTLDDVAAFADPIVNFAVLVVPYLSVMILLGSPLFAAMWLRLQRVKGPHFTDAQERKLRSVPLAVGLWGLIVMHFFLIVSPRMTQTIASTAIARDILEIIVMGFGFFATFGVLNVLMRAGLERKMLRKLNLLDVAVLMHLMGALGIGLFAWATVRHASVWTATVAWQHYIDSFTFSQGSDPAIYSLPIMAKLHVVMGSLALAILLQSRVVTLMLIPKPRLWTTDAALLGFQVPRDHGRAAALMYGITVEDDKKIDEGKH